MSLRRKIALVMAGVFVLFLVVLALVPFLFRDQIEARVKQAIADNINARVDWHALSLSLIRDFPNASMQLTQLSVVGVGPFSADTLAAVPRFRMEIELPSLLRAARGTGPLVVRTILVSAPRARLIVLQNGTANWDIMKPRPARPAASRTMDVKLRELKVEAARVAFDNRKTGVVASIAGLDESLSGDFAKQHFTLETRTSADTTSLQFAGVPYLSDVRFQVAARLGADMAKRTFTLEDNDVRVNGLQLRAAGSVALLDSAVAINLAFKAPRTQFRDILSLVPTVYSHNFGNLQTSGAMALDGQVRGRYGKHDFPAFALRVQVDNGSFRYPDLPLPARDIFIKLSLTNPGGSADSSFLNIERAHLVLGSDPIDGSLTIRTPVSDPNVGARLTGRIDLANVTKTIKLDSVKELKGIIVANAAMQARMSDVDHKRYERVNASGTIQINQMALQSAQLRQPIRINDALLRLSPRQAELASFHGNAGSSDLTMAGSLENLLGFVLHKEPLRGTATVASRHFNLNEWRSNDAMQAIAVPGNIDFALNATADTVLYGALTMRNAHGSVRIKDSRATLEDFQLQTLGGDMKVSGFYETVVPAKPNFDLAVDMTDVNPAAAFTDIKTVQAFAPVAKYAEGKVSAKMKLSGPLTTNMLPVFQSLSALGSLVTSGLVLKSFPPLDGLSNLLKLPQLKDPGFIDLKSSFAIENGRLAVKPFDVRTGPITMTVAGSNGIDQSLDYNLALKVPRAILGSEANAAFTSIINRTARAGFNLQAAENITLGVQLGGTVLKPRIATSFKEATGNLAQNVATSVREQATARVDSTAMLARQKIIAAAEKQAASIRENADTLAARLRREGYARADSLETRATGLKKIAARLAADKLRKETDAKASALVREADTRAQALVDEAKKRAGASAQ